MYKQEKLVNLGASISNIFKKDETKNVNTNTGEKEIENEQLALPSPENSPVLISSRAPVATSIKTNPIQKFFNNLLTNQTPTPTLTPVAMPSLTSTPTPTPSSAVVQTLIAKQIVIKSYDTVPVLKISSDGSFTIKKLVFLNDENYCYDNKENTALNIQYQPTESTERDNPVGKNFNDSKFTAVYQNVGGFVLYKEGIFRLIPTGRDTGKTCPNNGLRFTLLGSESEIIGKEGKPLLIPDAVLIIGSEVSLSARTPTPTPTPTPQIIYVTVTPTPSASVSPSVMPSPTPTPTPTPSPTPTPTPQLIVNISSDKSQIGANGQDTAIITVKVRNVDGTPIADKAVLETRPQAKTLITNSEGIATFTVTTTQITSFSVTVAVDGKYYSTQINPISTTGDVSISTSFTGYYGDDHPRAPASDQILAFFNASSIDSSISDLKIKSVKLKLVNLNQTWFNNVRITNSPPCQEGRFCQYSTIAGAASYSLSSDGILTIVPEIPVGLYAGKAVYVIADILHSPPSTEWGTGGAMLTYQISLPDIHAIEVIGKVNGYDINTINFKNLTSALSPMTAMIKSNYCISSAPATFNQVVPCY